MLCCNFALANIYTVVGHSMLLLTCCLGAIPTPRFMSRKAERHCCCLRQFASPSIIFSIFPRPSCPKSEQQPYHQRPVNNRSTDPPSRWAAQPATRRTSWTWSLRDAPPLAAATGRCLARTIARLVSFPVSDATELRFCNVADGTHDRRRLIQHPLPSAAIACGHGSNGDCFFPS